MYFIILNLLATILFIVGLLGVAFNRRNLLTILISIELILLGANLHFLVSSVFFGDIKGQIFSLFILSVAAAESAIGLSILVVLYRLHQTATLGHIWNLRN